MATTRGTARESGFVLSTAEWQIVAGAGGLSTLNVLGMVAVSFTPLVLFVDLVYSIPILGIVVYGALLSGGEWMARTGVTEGRMGLALVGTAVLQFAFATFGGWTLSLLQSTTLRVVAIGIAGFVTVGITVLVAIYVYYRSDTDFGHWKWLSMGAFVLGVLAGLVGTLVTVDLLVAFPLFLLGFWFLLGWEIYQVRDRTRGSPPMYHAIGIYVAFMGVFVHILRIVVSFLARE